MLPNDIAGIGEILRLNEYCTAAFGKWHETAVWEISPSGPFARCPNYQGFDEFYGFMGGETNQWAPAVYHNQNRVETPDDPDYHFMNDMASHLRRPGPDDLRRLVDRVARHAAAELGRKEPSERPRQLGDHGHRVLRGDVQLAVLGPEVTGHRAGVRESRSCTFSPERPSTA